MSYVVSSCVSPDVVNARFSLSEPCPYRHEIRVDSGYTIDHKDWFRCTLLLGGSANQYDLDNDKIAQRRDVTRTSHGRYGGIVQCLHIEASSCTDCSG